MKRRVNRKALTVLLMFVLTIFCAVACSKSEQPLPSLKLNYNDLNVKMYTSITIEATIEHIEGEISWEVTDETVIDCTVSEDKKSIKILAVKDGKTTVTASIGNNSDSCVITVNSQNQVPVLRTNKSKLELVTGSSLTVVSTVTFDNGALDAEYTYLSLNTEIAQVIDGGVVTAVSEGETQILVTASYVNYSDTLEVDVVVKPKTFVVPSVKQITIYEQSDYESYVSKKAVSAKVLKDGEQAEQALINWQSLDDTVAVYEDGIIKGIREGETSIEIIFTEDETEYKGIINVTVLSVPVVSFSLSESNVLLYMSSPTLSYVSSLDIAHTVSINSVTENNAVVHWESNNTTVAEIENGTVTAKNEGTAVIKAVYILNQVAYEQYVNVTVKAVVTQDENAVAVAVREKNAVFVKQDVDLSNGSKEEPFIQFDFDVLDKDGNVCNNYAESQGKIKPIKNINVVLEDASDRANYLIIRFRGTGTPFVDAGFYTGASLDGTTFKGWRTTLRTDGRGIHTYGEDVRLSFAKEAGIDTLYMWTGSAYEKLIQPSIDLASSWSGFTDGKVKIFAYADTFTDENALLKVTFNQIDGQSVTKEKIYVNYGIHSGTTVNIGATEKLQYNNIIDLNGKTVEDMFIEYHIIPNNEEYIDASSIFIELTDVEDASKVLMFKNFKNGISQPDRSFAVAGIPSYISARVGLETTGEDKIKSNMAVGFLVKGSFSGYYLMDFSGAGMGFSLDISTGDVYAKCGRQPISTIFPNNFIMNYNNDAYIPSNRWSGFGSGRYYMTIYADGYNLKADKTTLLIQSVGGRSVAVEDFTYVAK